MSVDEAHARLKGFVEAWEPHEPRERSLGEPDGIAGTPGKDGAYHDLLYADLVTLVDEFPLARSVRLQVRDGDIVVICPNKDSLTPNQAREWQRALQEHRPEMQWLVLPLPADVVVLAPERVERLQKENG